MTELLRAERVEKSFGAVQVLHGITLSVGEAEAVGLCGPNGAGKTLLADVLSGVIRPERGKVVYEGRDITRLSMEARVRAGIARTFQIPGPYPSLTVAESVRVALRTGRPAGGPTAPRAGTIGEQADAVLRRTGLFAQRALPASRLSQGCLQRLELARAIACCPRVLVLDEVFSGLSAPDESELASLVQSLRKDEGIAFLLISHSPSLLAGLCPRVVALADGRVAWEGSASELPSGRVPCGETHGVRRPREP